MQFKKALNTLQDSSLKSVSQMSVDRIYPGENFKEKYDVDKVHYTCDVSMGEDGGVRKGNSVWNAIMRQNWLDSLKKKTWLVFL